MAIVRTVELITLLLLSLAVPKVVVEGCPPARPLRHFQVESILGGWHVVQFYSSGEEGSAPYRCMRANLSLANGATASPKLHLLFSYVFADDPKRETLVGNLTWDIPEKSNPAHWVHAEDPYDGVYDTFVLDADPSSWALLLHCARNPKSTAGEEEVIRDRLSPLHNVVGTGYGGWRGQIRVRRFLSAFILSRQEDLNVGPLAFLRDKLPPYGVNLEYVSKVEQSGCNPGENKGKKMEYEIYYEEGEEERRLREERRKTKEEEEKEDREMEVEDQMEEEGAGRRVSGKGFQDGMRRLNGGAS